MFIFAANRVKNEWSADKTMMIKEFEDKGINVTWTLLFMCFNSNNILENNRYEQRFISGRDIIDYAIELLTDTSNPQIVSLAIQNVDDEENILGLLQKLSEEENMDYQLEFRKFRAMYIYVNLPRASENYVHGILKISEIWNKFGFPEDSPNIFLKFSDYSQENFEKIVEINEKWLLQEFKRLQEKR